MAVLPEDQDDHLERFRKNLILNEMFAHWSAKNKIREGLLLCISRRIAEGKDVKKLMTALEALSKDIPPPDVFLDSLSGEEDPAATPTTDSK